MNTTSTSPTHAAARVRRYQLADRPGLLACIDAVCAEELWMMTPRYTPTPAWEHALAAPGCACHLLLVAVSGGQVLGWCRAFRNPGDLSADIGLGLLPPSRLQGLGGRMLRRSIAWARSGGMQALTLDTRRDNTVALHLFAKLGFVPCGDAPPWLPMRLDL